MAIVIVSNKQRSVPRRRMHREFYRWLIECRGQFAHRPVIVRRDDRSIRFRFQGITEALIGILTTEQLWAAVEVDGECWDFLLNFDCFPVRYAGEYRCGFDLRDLREAAVSREAFWRRQLFTPLLAWINGPLASAHGIQLYSFGDSTSARLVSNPAPDHVSPRGVVTLTLRA